MVNYIELGNNIAKLRIKHGLTQFQLAEHCDVVPAFISSIERGIKKPSIETLVKIAIALQVPVDRLITNYSIDDIKSPYFLEVIKLLGYFNDTELSHVADIIRSIIKLRGK